MQLAFTVYRGSAYSSCHDVLLLRISVRVDTQELPVLRRNRMHSVVSKLKAFAFVLALLSLMALGSGLAYGQAISGNLVGTVIDSSSAVVTNASVEASNLGTGLTTSATTNTTGGYRFDNLPVGSYKIIVKASGFRTTTV